MTSGNKRRSSRQRVKWVIKFGLVYGLKVGTCAPLTEIYTTRHSITVTVSPSCVVYELVHTFQLDWVN